MPTHDLSVVARNRRPGKLGATVAIAQTQQRGRANRAARATIAFCKRNRPDGPGADDRNPATKDCPASVGVGGPYAPQ